MKTPYLALSLLSMACASTCAQTITAADTPEYLRSSSAVQLKLGGLQLAGVAGSGVTVALLDTGMNRGNPEFNGNARFLNGYNVNTGTNDVTDTLGHGTHVAGIIAAGANGFGLVGVAPMARLLPVKIFASSTASGSSIDKGLAYARQQGARVVNLSLGATGPTGTVGLKAVAATNNIVVAAAAGNSALASPNWPARYAKEAWANGTIIAVGAVDANRNIASFSNRAGDTANYYLVAPGVNIYSTYGNGYALMSGTSMAAPAVAGAAALVTGYWPYLKANQVANILLSTADDLGAPGTDAIYGRGMLNVSRALSPTGTLKLVSNTGAKTTVSIQTLSAGLFRPRVASAKAFADLKTNVFDEDGRNFMSDPGSTSAGNTQMTLDSVLGRSDRLLDGSQVTLADGSRVMKLQSRSTGVMSPWSSALRSTGQSFGLEEPTWRKAAPGELGSMMFVQGADGSSVAAGDGGLGSLAMGLAASNQSERIGGTESLLVNPLASYAPAHRFAMVGMPVGMGFTARAGALMASDTQRAHGDVQVVEVMHEGRDHAINVSLGQLDEKGLLGGFSSPAFGLNQASKTTGVTFSGAYALDRQWMLTGAWSTSHTRALSSSGLLTAATPVKSQGYGIGLVKGDTWRDGDRLSLTVQAPLAARSGRLNYEVVEGVDAQTGAPRFANRVVDLKAQAQEWLTEARYVTRLGRDTQITAVAAWRQNPDNDPSARPQLLLGARWQHSF